MSNISSSHQTSIVVTPATLKHQIITRLNTLVGKAGGEFYPTDEKGNTKPLTTIDGMEVQGIESKGRSVYLMCVPSDETVAINLDIEEGIAPYDANDFYLEQLWDVYMACEPIYQSRMVDYGSMQD